MVAHLSVFAKDSQTAAFVNVRVAARKERVRLPAMQSMNLKKE